jgi:hypothetical protein
MSPQTLPNFNSPIELPSPRAPLNGNSTTESAAPPVRKGTTDSTEKATVNNISDAVKSYLTIQLIAGSSIDGFFQQPPRLENAYFDDPAVRRALGGNQKHKHRNLHKQ